MVEELKWLANLESMFFALGLLAVISFRKKKLDWFDVIGNINQDQSQQFAARIGREHLHH